MSTPASASVDSPSRRCFFKTLWFWVVLAFILLIAAWTTIIMIAVKNGPAAVDLEQLDNAPQQNAATVEAEAGE
ncbi:hypothetical protein H5P28_11015 [Ruficoccus amylovorans]|uniref:Uncharacterized protein n=1 Tax=Ruficoccus amylovorans TaxID=1804625 RepID=A0A842HEY7_9BACT|nr:hypothetical protein [Ruficoccus amylovorans]MBC2594790.1 hypothetical protein [Ruficoccus amylovorans]